MAPAIPDKMKAVQLIQFKEKYEIHNIPVPRPGPNDLLIKVHAAGFCHTDYQVWEGIYESPRPLVPSHEPVGIIVAMGTAAEEGGKWKIGQRAGVLLFRHQCHHCIGCDSADDVRFCKNKDMAGLAADGGMGEYIIGDADNCVLIPESVSFEQAAPLMCAGATTWAGLKAANVTGPAPIGIVGIGGLGSLAVQFAKALGHAVVAIDNRPEGRDLATEFRLKADKVIDYGDPDAVEKIKTWAGRDGLAAVIVCTDNVEATEWSLNVLRPHGVAVPLGLPPAGFKFSAFTVIFNELVIKGSLVATRDQVEDMMRLVAEHQISSHITTIGIDDAPNVTGMYMNPNLKGRLVVKIAS